MSDFEKALNFTMKWEGGYSNNPYDAGGETNYGISARFLKGAGIEKSVKDLTFSEVKKIYDVYFYTAQNLDKYSNFGLKLYLFDTAVNCGKFRATDFLQQSIFCFRPIAVDGISGEQTRRASNDICGNKAECEQFFQSLINMRLGHYMNIVNKNDSQRVFYRGWINRVTDLYREMKKYI